jgi:hypothetical protein
LFRAGFLLRILLCSQSGDHPENNLAKFGYILDIKLEKIKSFSILRYLLELFIKIWRFEKKILAKFGEFKSFFPLKILV